MLTDVEERADVRMIKLRNCLGFALEAFPEFRIGGKSLWKNFNGDGPLKSGIPCLIDLTHTASAERRNDLVCAESGARGKCHCRGRAHHTAAGSIGEADRL